MNYLVSYITRYWFSDDQIHTVEMTSEELDHFQSHISTLRCGETEILYIEPLNAASAC